MLVLCFGMSDDTCHQIWVLHGIKFQVSWMNRYGNWSQVSGIICVTGIPSTWYQVLAGVWYLVPRDRCQVSDIRSERNTWWDGSWGRDDFLDVQPPVSYLSQLNIGCYKWVGGWVGWYPGGVRYREPPPPPPHLGTPCYDISWFALPLCYSVWGRPQWSRCRRAARDQDLLASARQPWSTTSTTSTTSTMSTTSALTNLSVVSRCEF